MDTGDCISCPYVTNKLNCGLHLCACEDIGGCDYFNDLQLMRRELKRAKGQLKKKRGWRDVFDQLTPSEGPGDNIYVYG